MDALAPVDDVDVESCVLEEGAGGGLLGGRAGLDFLEGPLIDRVDRLELGPGRVFPGFQDPPEPRPVARFAGLVARDRDLALDQPAAGLLVEHVAALATQALLEHDVGHGVVDPLAALAGVEDLLGLVGAGVAGDAVGDRLHVLDDLVLDGQVALGALDLVLGDVGVVDEHGVGVLVQALLLEVALVAVFPGHGPVAHDHLAMALVAFEIVGEDRGVVVAGRVRGQRVLFVAVRAGADLGRVLGLLEMAEETAALGDRDVLALDDLGMAARAAELLAPFQVGEVGLMVEGDRFELHRSFEEPPVVAAFLEAALVLDLGPGLGFQIELGPVPADHDQAFHFGLESVGDPGRIMADLAFDGLVGGGLPALVERLHVMADRAELGCGRQLDRGDEDHDQDPQGDQDGLRPDLPLLPGRGSGGLSGGGGEAVVHESPSFLSGLRRSCGGRPGDNSRRNR